MVKVAPILIKIICGLIKVGLIKVGLIKVGLIKLLSLAFTNSIKNVNLCFRVL